MRAIIAAQDTTDRTVLVDLCYSHGALTELTVVESGSEALQHIRNSGPEVVILVCDLKGMTVLDVLWALSEEERPRAIIVAPDERYATEVRSAAAADYLTSPVLPDRFALAIKRASTTSRRSGRRPIGKEERAPVPAESPCSGSISPGQAIRLVGEYNGRLYFFAPNHVDYIQADSNYVYLYVGNRRYMSRDSLTRLSPGLASFGFVRISRGILINLQRVKFAEREGNGVLAFVLESGARLVSSTRYRLESGAELRITRTHGTRRKHRTAL